VLGRHLVEARSDDLTNAVLRLSKAKECTKTRLGDRCRRTNVARRPVDVVIGVGFEALTGALLASLGGHEGGRMLRREAAGGKSL
jgi:hypothetical protein